MQQKADPRRNRVFRVNARAPLGIAVMLMPAGLASCTMTAMPPPADSDTVPANSTQLHAFLQSGGYLDWGKESAIHASAGPHGDVRAYLNALLDESLRNGNAEHPAGAAAVKELYQDGTLIGWAVSIKTEAASDGGDGWFWYETHDTVDSAAHLVAGMGVAGCSDCHSVGADYVRSSYPLN